MFDEKENCSPRRELIEWWNIYGDNAKENKPSERYLLELLNAGRHFGTHFEYVEKQIHGEPDIRGENGYELDFKLFLSTAEGKSRKDFIKNHRNNYFDYYDLAEVIKDKTAEELENIANGKNTTEYNAEQVNIVKHFLKKCRTNKHLLFFAPRYFYADTTDEILEYFNDVVRGAMEYRETQVVKDTYFSWIQSFKGMDDLYKWDSKGKLMRTTNVSLILAKYDEQKNKLKIVDVVALRKSKYFLRHHVNQFEYSHQMFW